ncbi:MAG: DUF2442 domain-containing protein [Nitrospinae bacterium]|nr:DUF2442 domain-containing protein [Nitrospinota bacterium]
MCYDVVEAKYIKAFELTIVFENGKTGTVDFKDYAKLGGVFDRFTDLAYFRKFYVNKEIGALCWPDDLDIAPETLYHDATGEPLPEWTKTVTGNKAL